MTFAWLPSVPLHSFFFFFGFVFWCGPFFQVSIEHYYNITSVLFWIWGPKAWGTLASWLGIEHAPPAMQGEVLTTGPPGKSLYLPFSWKISLTLAKAPGCFWGILFCTPGWGHSDVSNAMLTQNFSSFGNLNMNALWESRSPFQGSRLCVCQGLRFPEIFTSFTLQPPQSKVPRDVW